MATVEPRTVKGRATRGRIVRAATTLIAERGVAGTTLDDVRERAQASKSQLYHYFTDRDDLLRAAVRETTDGVLEAQEGHFAALGSWAGLNRWADALVTLQHERQARGGCPIGSLAGQLAEHDEASRSTLAAGLDSWQTAIRTGLQTMQAEGELRADADADALAFGLLAAVQGGLVLSQVRRDPLQLRAAFDGALAPVAASLTA